MPRVLRILSVVLALAGLVVLTWFVMEKNRRMSLFLEARDRLHRGEPQGLVLHRLRGAIHWSPEEDDAARRIAREAFPGELAPRSIRLRRAGPWALLEGGTVGPALLERTLAGWGEVR